MKIQRFMTAAMLTAAIAGGTYAFLGSPLVPSVQAHLKDHPILEASDHSLKDAHEYLEAAPHDFHGHRAAAIHAIQEARHQISLLVNEEEGKKNTPSQFSAAPVAPERHPRLTKAHHDLEAAEKYLAEMKGDARGHKEKALEWIREANKQIKICMEI